MPPQDLSYALHDRLGVKLGWPEEAATTFAEIQTIFTGGAVFTADYYAMDGVTGKTQSLIDWLDGTHVLQQTTSAQQCAEPAVSAAFNNQKVMTFSGAQRYDSNRTSAYWKFLHDGTGGTLVAVFSTADLAAFRVIAATQSNTTTVGARMTTSTVPSFTAGASNGTLGMFTAAGGTPVVDTPYIIEFGFKNGAGSPETTLYNGTTLLYSGDCSPTPSSANATAPLRLGAYTGATSHFSGKLAALLAAPKVLSTTERSQLRSWAVATYGSVAP